MLDEEKFASGDAVEASTDARISHAHGLARRAKNPQSSSEKRPLATSPRVTSRATFRPAERLKLSARFRTLHQRGAWAKSPTVAVGMLPNGLPHSRLAIRTQRGLRGAIERNRAKRLVRELYRQNKTEFGTGQDVLVVLKQLHQLTLTQLTEDIVRLCHKLKTP